MVRVILICLNVFVFIMLAQALLSWFPLKEGKPVERMRFAMTQASAPVLNPVRKVIPPVKIFKTPVDLSLLVVMMIIQIMLMPLVASFG